MPRHVDALTAPTLKHLREHWWDADFSAFLGETLRPRPGNRILDVGCGEGTAELSLGRMQVSQVDLVAIDRRLERVRQTLAAGNAHNIRLKVAAADAQHLPFKDASFDSTFCVAVLQHVGDLAQAVRELARVTKEGGRVVAVEPDNSARYWYSSLEAGRRTFDAAGRFFAALTAARGDTSDPRVGPKLATAFAANGIEPLWVKPFPVAVSRLGSPPAQVWDARRAAIQTNIDRARSDQVETLGQAYLEQLDRYAREAAAAGPGFVEIQNTMLFATVGQRQA